MQIKEPIYIVAGDEMQKLMNIKYPERKTIPFCEDLSKGSFIGYNIDKEFITARSSFWDVPENDYFQKMLPIINIDITKNYILCFGEDECCAANLKFLIEYLKYKGYSKSITVQIVNEYNLQLLKAYKALTIK